MKLQQLRFVLAIANNGLNVSKAAKNLYTSQPGVSKQLRLLEEELGITIFQRNGKQLVETTAHGKVVLEKIEKILNIVAELKVVANLSEDAIAEEMLGSELSFPQLKTA